MSARAELFNYGSVNIAGITADTKANPVIIAPKQSAKYAVSAGPRWFIMLFPPML